MPWRISACSWNEVSGSTTSLSSAVSLMNSSQVTASSRWANISFTRSRFGSLITGLLDCTNSPLTG